MLLCIDIGNTHTHHGLLAGGKVLTSGKVPTPRLAEVLGEYGLTPGRPAFVQRQAAYGDLEGVAFCSVVPTATARLRPALLAAGFTGPVFQLTHDKKIGMPVTYPHPAEIGQDRLANAAAAHALGVVPAVIIDLGTAVTFDVVTAQGGYEGGIIAPGLAVMRHYLHERTAQLPEIDDSLEVSRAIGRSTVEAMRIGMVLGFMGMIQALLDAVRSELAARSGSPPTVLATGGYAEHFAARLRPPARLVPQLTLLGLEAACRLNG